MTGPLMPPDGSALDTIPAGRYAFQVNTGTEATPTWVFVNGLTNFEPTYKPKLEDDSDITSDGWESQAVTGNAHSIALEGLIKGENATGFVPDPGMTFLVEASKQTGSNAHIHGRYWRTDELTEAVEAHYAVDCSLKGGKPTELQKFGGTLTGRGKPKDITKPTATP